MEWLNYLEELGAIAPSWGAHGPFSGLLLNDLLLRTGWTKIVAPGIQILLGQKHLGLALTVLHLLK